MWRHNSHRAIIKIPDEYDLANISSLKVYSISDEDEANITFPSGSVEVTEAAYNQVLSAGAYVVGETSGTNAVGIDLADGKHNLFAIFAISVTIDGLSTQRVYLTNLEEKGALGVQSVLWEGLAPENDPFGNINLHRHAELFFPQIAGDLIFPESNTPPGHAEYSPQTKVIGTVFLTHPVPEGMTAILKARVLDPDHFGDGEFDPNVVISGKDNVGGIFKSASAPIKLAVTEEAFTLEFIGGSITTAIVNSKTLNITASQPGNNWIIGVHDEASVTDELQMSATDGTTVVRIVNFCEYGISATNASVILTAARTLWVETDTMNAPGVFAAEADDFAFAKNPLDTSLLVALMRQALVVVKDLPSTYDVSDGMPFVYHYLQDSNSNSLADGIEASNAVRDVNSDEYFWVVHNVDAYEHQSGNQLDNDSPGPDSQGNLNTRDSGDFYVGYAHGQNQDWANAIYHETIRDVHAEPETSDRTPGGRPLVDLTTHMQIVVAHESLHRFLGYHTDSANPNAPQNANLMGYQVQFDSSLAFLSLDQLRRIQNQKLPR